MTTISKDIKAHFRCSRQGPRQGLPPRHRQATPVSPGRQPPAASRESESRRRHRQTSHHPQHQGKNLV